MTSRRQLILVSNRGPVGFSRSDAGEVIEVRGAGGLVTALRPMVAQHNVTWIASALSDEDRRVATEGATTQLGQEGSPYRLRLVAHDPRAYDLYYNVVANPALWFAQHGLDGMQERRRAELPNAWELGYVPVNEAFAGAVVEELDRDPGAAVFFHDYHLYAAPALVRERRPHALLAHFVHIPWAEPAEWELLPEPIVRAVHEGLLANDVVGFHTERWRRAFLRSCEALGLDASRTLVTAHPISVDPGEFDEVAGSPEVLQRERELAERRPERLILRVDRTDPSKNVVRGFQAFRLLLDRRPDLVGRVAMLALLDPSRQGIAEYADYRAAIEREADVLAAAYPDALTLRIADDFPESVAAYKQYDVLLVNAVRDGLNLVSKEAPLVNTRDGVVVLSENAGAFEELEPWVVGIDPFDVAAQADALERALELPADERASWAAALSRHVREHDLERWSAEQLEDLDRVSTMRA
jgi:trehalose 6-phosphate synthase